MRYQQAQLLLLDNGRVLRTIRPSKPYKQLRRIVCLGAGEAWVIGEKANVKRIDIHGSVKEKVRFSMSILIDAMLFCRNSLS